MNHDELRNRIGALLDGELPPEEATHLERHLAGCASCRALRDETVSLSAALRDLPRETMPADLRADLMGRARGAGGTRRTASIFLRPWALASVASAALLVVVVAIAIRSGSPDGGAPPFPGTPPTTPTAMKDAPARPERSAEAQRVGGGDTPSPVPRVEPLRQPGPPAAAREESGPPAEATAGARERASARTAGSAGAPLPDRDDGSGPAPSPAPRMRVSPGDEGKTLGPEMRVDKPSGPGRYAMTMTRTGDGRLGLGPLVPLGASPAMPAPGEPPAGSTGVRRLDASVSGGSPPAGAAGEPHEDVRYDGPPVTLVFLLRTDESGLVLSADPIGARLVPPPTMRAIAAMLVGSMLQPHRPDDPTLLALQISLPAGP